MMRPVARGLKQVGKIWDSQVGLGCLHICHNPKSFYELTLESGYDHFMYYLIQVDFRRTVKNIKTAEASSMASYVYLALCIDVSVCCETSFLGLYRRVPVLRDLMEAWLQLKSTPP